ncbi:MAG: hypothetical protein AAF721_36865, partial [Myxococcota bacterium]
IPRFDLDRTIFKTLEGRAARFVMRKRVGKEVFWSGEAAESIRQAYEETGVGESLPAVDDALMRFLIDDCDFDVEHADGSFLDHLYFCFEYTALHYPSQSALVMFLHSILGTGTNTFAMDAAKIPTLQGLLSPFDWAHTEAFPSVLRLLYAGPLREELRANLHRVDALASIEFRRVIDNAPITMSGEDFWIAMNYQLIHLVDFLPVANWSANRNDTSYILFRDLYELMTRAGKLDAKIDYAPARGPRTRTGEDATLGGWLLSRIPVSVSDAMARKSVERFSGRIGHSLEYTIDWGGRTSAPGRD